MDVLHSGKQIARKWKIPFLLQTIIAILFYSILVVYSGKILDLSPSQMTLPDFSLRADKSLNICVLHWDIESLKHHWNLGLTEAPIFYPNRYGRFFSEHLFGHLILAYPLSWIVDSPQWIYNLTYQLNRLVIATGMFLLCFWITSSFSASLVAGTLLILGWNFGQIQNTGLGWSILTILLFLKHLTNPEWKYVPWLVVFGILTGLCSGYLAFFTPLALLILLITRCVYKKTFPDKNYWIQAATAVILIGLVLSPVMLIYKKVQEEYGLVRTNYTVATLECNWIKESNKKDEEEQIEEKRTYNLSRIGCIQIIFSLLWLFFLLRKRPPFDGDGWSFLALALLSYWMASSFYSPYTLASGLPGFNGLRAAQRWFLFMALAITVLNAMTIAQIFQKVPNSVRMIFCFLILLVTISIGSKSQSIYLTRLRPGFPVYNYLRTLPPGPICSLPAIDPDKEHRVRITGARMIYQLLHRFPMTSGYSGLFPPLTTKMEAEIRDKGLTKRTIYKLAQTGVKYLVVDKMAGDTFHLRRQLRSVRGVRILYDKEEEMIIELPAVPVEANEQELLNLWSGGSQNE
jgi:hypothetical protein